MSDGITRRVRQLAGRGAVAAGAVGAAYGAARARWVKSGLSEPRNPYVWKPEPGRRVLLKNMNLIDLKRGQVLKERGILYRDGEILEVVPTRDLAKAEERADRAFDCEGLYALPGFVNCHVHALLPGASYFNYDLVLSLKRQAMRNLEDAPVNGVTTVRDASGCSGVLARLSGRIERLDMLGPRVVGCGAIIKPPGGYPEFSVKLPATLVRKVGETAIYATTPEEGREAVRRSVECGANFIKIFLDDRSLFFGLAPLPVLDDATITAIVEEAHALGRRVAAHLSMIAGFRRAVRLGIDDFEHVPADAALEPADVEAFMKGEHNVTPTVSVGMALGIAHRGHPALDDPTIRTMQAVRRKVLYDKQPLLTEPAVMKANMVLNELYMAGKAGHTLMTKSSFDPELFFEAFRLKNPNLKLLYEAGASICCGNDGGTPFAWPGMLSVEMELMAMFGMSNIDVLRTATANAARLLDMDTEIGTIEPGKLADVVLLSDNPVRDIRAVERVEAAFRSGVLLHVGPGFSGK